MITVTPEKHYVESYKDRNHHPETQTPTVYVVPLQHPGLNPV